MGMPCRALAGKPFLDMIVAVLGSLVQLDFFPFLLAVCRKPIILPGMEISLFTY